MTGHVHNSDHVNSIRSNAINYAVRMLKDFSQLADAKLRNRAPGYWKSLNLSGTNNDSLDHSAGVVGGGLRNVIVY